MATFIETPTETLVVTFGSMAHLRCIEPRPLVERVELVCGDRRLVCERSLLAGVLQLSGGPLVSVTEQMFDLARDVVRGLVRGGAR